MGATVSVISEELCRPVNACDLTPDIPVDALDVIRLRELLHIAFKDGENLDDDALTPELAREVNQLLTKCAKEPGISRLSNDEVLRGLLEEQEEQAPNEAEPSGGLGSEDWGSRSFDGNWSTSASLDLEGGGGSPSMKGGLNRARTQHDLSTGATTPKRFDVKSLARMHASSRFEGPRSSILGTSISMTDLTSLSPDKKESHDKRTLPTKEGSPMPPRGVSLSQNFDTMKLRPRAAPRRGSGVSRLSTVMSQSHCDDDDSPEVKFSPAELSRNTSLSPSLNDPLDVAVSAQLRGRPVPLSLGLSSENGGQQAPPPAANTQAQAGANGERRRPVPLALNQEPAATDGGGGRRRPVPLTLNQEPAATDDGGRGRRRPMPLALNSEPEPTDTTGYSGSGGRQRPAPIDESMAASKFGEDEENDPLENSCVLSKTGTLEYNNFRISTEGIVQSPSESGSVGGSFDSPSLGGGVSRQSKVRHSIIDPAAGSQPFLLLQPLGCGASGSVAKSLHMATLQLVAIKTLPIFDAGKRRQMIKELKLLYKWKQDIQGLDDEGESPHCNEIVSFYDAFSSSESSSVNLVLEYMNGGSLQDVVDKGGVADEAFLAQISAGSLRGLRFLHETSKPRKIHRDIKPANVLINTRGECKVADFGVYREMDANASANAQTFVGSLSYMSPERITGGSYDCPADIWSMGLTIMTVALGRCPINDNGRGYWALLHELTDKPPPTLPPDGGFSDLFADFLAQMLTAKPEDRWPASKLLAHPFLAAHGHSAKAPPIRDSVCSPVDPDSGEVDYVGDLQRNELAQVIDALAHRCTELLAERAKADSSSSAPQEELPYISEAKLMRFSSQIDMPIGEVRRAFEVKFDGVDLPRLLV